MKNFRRMTGKPLLGLLFLLAPVTVFASGETLNPVNPSTRGASLQSLLGYIQNYFLGFAGALAIFFIIWGGIRLMTSSGNPQRLEGAKKTLTYAIAGLILIIMSQIILSLLTGSIFTSILSGGKYNY